MEFKDFDLCLSIYKSLVRDFAMLRHPKLCSEIGFSKLLPLFSLAVRYIQLEKEVRMKQYVQQNCSIVTCSDAPSEACPVSRCTLRATLAV